MKYFRVLMLSLITTAACADTAINESLDAAEDGEVVVSNVSGSVEVSGWSRNQVEVTGSLGDGVEELIFERDDDEILIKVKLERRKSRSGSAELVIKVPEKSSLKVNTVSADIDVQDVHGEQDLQVVSGDIEVEFYAEELKAEAVSGDVSVSADNQESNARVSTVSGDIDIENLAGELKTETVSGDIDVIEGSFSRITAETVNGDMVLRANFQPGGRMDLETVNGSVDVDFEGNLSAEINVETFNGSIRNCFGPDPVRTSKYAPGRELDFTEGGGNGRVRIRTLNGSVRLCK